MKLSKIKNMIENNPVALATSSGKKPHVIGVAYVKVVGTDKLLVTDAYMKTTVSNIKKNKNVSLAVWDKRWKGYTLQGTAAYFTKGRWADHVKNMKENKGHPVKGAILISVK